MINKVTLIGNLGQNPEVRRLESGVAVAKYSVATNENYKDKNGEWQKQTEWHDVVVWRELAESAEKNLKKGMMVYVEGKITYRKYTDQNGVERKLTEIVASLVRILEKREGGAVTPNSTDYFPSEASAPAPVSARATAAPQASPQYQTPASPSGTSHVAPPPASHPEDDLPF